MWVLVRALIASWRLSMLAHPAASWVRISRKRCCRNRATAAALGLDHVEFREGLAEDLPVENGWADVVISNGVINLCGDKQTVFKEIHRVLRRGGYTPLTR
jgi:ubiquinone/menaquinone biosynthesis C-methylase UbiE